MQSRSWSPLAGTRYGTLYKFLNAGVAGALFMRYDFRQRQMLTFSRAEYPMCAVILLRDLDTQPVCRLDSLTNAQLIPPRVAYCVAGKVNGADELYLVIESVRRDTKYLRSSTVPVPADGAGGSPIG